MGFLSVTSKEQREMRSQKQLFQFHICKEQKLGMFIVFILDSSKRWWYLQSKSKLRCNKIVLVCSIWHKLTNIINYVTFVIMAANFLAPILENKSETCSSKTHSICLSKEPNIERKEAKKAKRFKLRKVTFQNY